MNLKSLITSVGIALTIASCSNPQVEAGYDIVPLPNDIQLNDSSEPFAMSKSTVIAYLDESLGKEAAFLSEYVAQCTGYALNVAAADPQADNAGQIVLKLNDQIENPEGYTLTVDPSGIVIEGSTPSGVFYGIQTLRKAIPADAKNATVLFPVVTITDQPRFGYRGMHLDVARHYFKPEFVKQYIDLLALHNMNTLHWHITDDQGWRMEIKKYPKLTEVGSVRHRTVRGHNGSGEYDEEDYGGFYTQDEMKDIVAYAAERHITVVPEIDLPGHMLGALAAYPEFGCTGGPYEVEGNWGVFDDVLCIGNDKVLEFLEDVMAEVIEIFPSKYIHIGGDECPKVRWHDCPKCQARIKAEGIKADKEHSAEDRLQSWCMARIERYLNDHGRQIIGWDEILEGDVAPNATIMSWRGSAGGIKAAQMGHDVIMTPNTHCYFDYYQTANTDEEPLSIGGYLPVQKVYSLEPTDALTEEQATHIIGVQANVWTEYIPDEDGILFRILPRMDALSEVQWTNAEKKDYNDFASRVERMLSIYERDGLPFCEDVREVKITLTPDTEAQAVVLELNVNDNSPIHYTLDGSVPTADSPIYSEPIQITETAQIRAVAIRGDKPGKLADASTDFSKATLKPVTFTAALPAPQYSYKGAQQLVDGLHGTKSWNSGEWLGFNGKDMEAVIDLGTETEISKATVTTCIDLPSWIDGIKGLEVFSSADGKEFKQEATTEFAPVDPAESIKTYEVQFPAVSTRYVKVKVVAFPGLPKGHAAEGQPGYYFIDEISVN